MANAYKKLAGGMATGRLSSANASLWIGADHLLLAERDGYGETYKRFYFGDIEAITIQETKWRTRYDIIMIIMLVIFLAVAFASSTVPRFVFLAFSAIMGGLIAINHAMGPTCTAFVKTAVQREELPAIRRVNRAVKILARVNEQIRVAQSGALSIDEVRQRFGYGLAAPPPIPAPPVIEPPTSSAPEAPQAG